MPDTTPHNTVIIPAHDVIKRAGLDIGMRCADLGVGREANFTIAAGKIVGPTGVVYTLDIVKAILPTIVAKAEMYGVRNVRPVWSDLEVYGAAKEIVDASLDMGMLVTVLFQSQQHKAMFAESLRMLKPGGTLLVVDWKKIPTPIGPPMNSRPDPYALKQLGKELGLQLTDEFEAGAYHFALVFKK